MNFEKLIYHPEYNYKLVSVTAPRVGSGNAFLLDVKKPGVITSIYAFNKLDTVAVPASCTSYRLGRDLKKIVPVGVGDSVLNAGYDLSQFVMDEGTYHLTIPFLSVMNFDSVEVYMLIPNQ